MSMMDQKIAPMLAFSGEPFDDPGWIFEIKWDGSRTIAFISDKVRLQDRRLVDITYQFPEMDDLRKCLKAKEVILDGELIVLKNNKPHYRSIMSRKHTQSALKIDLLSKTMPAVFVTWDILYLDGKSLVDLSLLNRKEILYSAVKPNDHLIIADFIFERGKMLYEETGKKGLEGVMAKKADSKYYIGKRSRLWLKLKHFITINAVIMGYRTDKIALILGLYDENGNLIPIGDCESGLSQRELSAFMHVAEDIKTYSEKNIQWIKPLLVCQVRFMEWSENMKMRAPAFVGFRYEVKTDQCRFT
ncbi:ATP-dependent DNA ligase [Caldanaerobius polysaccharolyticus]|uniref:ATP-dependent DNA ligase n=1 Tax=Caldanaerobius polysaccharolyticus TaxID=44256 RepID=UPI00047EA454|nr:DNA ligase [Caldanaerobius polysaccharolyticus]